jgi:hypothetical protein
MSAYARLCLVTLGEFVWSGYAMLNHVRSYYERLGHFKPCWEKLRQVRTG